MIDIIENIKSKLEYSPDNLFSSEEKHKQWVNKSINFLETKLIDNLIATQQLINTCYNKYLSLLPPLKYDCDLKSTITYLVLDYIQENNISLIKDIKLLAEDIISNQDSSFYLQNTLINNPSIFWQINADKKEYLHKRHIQIDEETIEEVKKANSRNDDIKPIQLINKKEFKDTNEIPTIDYLILFENEESIDSRIEYIADLYNSKSFFLDSMNRTVLYYFIARGNVKFIEKLCTRIHDKANEVVQNSGLTILEKFIQHKDSYGRTALHLAAKGGNLDIVQFLMNKKADILSKDEYGRTALHLAASNNSVQVVEALLSEKPNLADIKDEHGRTALHLAASNNNIDALNALITAGAIIDIQDGTDNEPFKRTPLHLACQEGHIDIVKLLLQKKSTLDISDGYQRTPLHFACMNGNQELIKLLINVGANVNKIDKYKQTSLHYAVYSQQVNAIEILIENGASLNIRDRDNRTPLMLALECNKNGIENIKIIISKLINYDYSIFVHEKWRKTSYLYTKESIRERKEFQNKDIYEFIDQIYSLLSKNPAIFKPLPEAQQTHEPLIIQAIKYNNIELINHIIINIPELITSLNKNQSEKLHFTIDNINDLNLDEVKRLIPFETEVSNIKPEVVIDKLLTAENKTNIIQDLINNFKDLRLSTTVDNTHNNR